MYERKKRDSVRAGSASYVSRRHFSTICQSPPFFFSPLSVLSGFNLHSVTPRAPSLAGCLFVEHSSSPGKMGSETSARAPLSSSARIQHNQGASRLRTSKYGQAGRRCARTAIFPGATSALLRRRGFCSRGAQQFGSPARLSHSWQWDSFVPLNKRYLRVICSGVWISSVAREFLLADLSRKRERISPIPP